MQSFWCLLFILPVLILAAKCPENSLYSDIFKGCIFVPTIELPWATSESYCHYLGGHLTVVDSAQKNAEFVNLTSQQIEGYQVIYIGLYTRNGMFQWVDGTDYDYNNFPHVTQPQPNMGIALQIVASDRAVTNTNDGEWYQLAKIASYRFSCTIPTCDNPTRPISGLDTYPGLIYSQNFDQWYLIAEEMMDQSYANVRCVNLGGTLPIISNAFENVDFSKILKQADSQYPVGQPHYYLGASSDINGTWTWPNGSPVTYANWAPNEPSIKYSGESIMDYNTGLWYSLGTSNKGFTCQLPAEPDIC